MSEAFANLNGFETFFAICSVVGGIFFLVRLVMQFSGFDTEGDLDADLDGVHSDPDASFRLLSLQGLSSFLLMFGLVGFALYRQNHAGFALSILGGSAAGLASVWLIGKLFVYAGRLQSNGTLDIRLAPGCEGNVYLTIPAGGTGKVTIRMQNRMREYEALSSDGSELPTGTPIRVVRVAGRTMIVEPIVIAH